MPAEQVEHYIRRAADFLRGMEFTRDDDAYRNSSALLAIHSAVSYCDALRIGLGDEQLAGDDHRSAAEKLRSLLNDRKYGDLTGLGHLQFLIARKSRVAYGSQEVDLRKCQQLANKAERFARWANLAGKHLNIGGWSHDDN
jgi:hypothetical protein